MNVFGDAQDISQVGAPHIERLQRLLRFHGLPCGSPGDLGLLLSALESNRPLRIDLAALANTLVQATPSSPRPVLTEDDLVTAIALASGGPSIAASLAGGSSFLLHAAPLLRMFLAGAVARSGAEAIAPPPAPSLHPLPELSPATPEFPSEPFRAPSPDRHPPRLVFSSLYASEPPLNASFPDPQPPSPLPPTAPSTPAEGLTPVAFTSGGLSSHAFANHAPLPPNAVSSPRLHPIPDFVTPPSSTAAHTGPAPAPERPVYHPLRRSTARTPVLRNLGFRLSAKAAYARHAISTAASRARLPAPSASSSAHLSEAPAANRQRALALAGSGLLLVLAGFALRFGVAHPRSDRSLLPNVHASVTPPPSVSVPLPPGPAARGSAATPPQPIASPVPALHPAPGSTPTSTPKAAPTPIPAPSQTHIQTPAQASVQTYLQHAPAAIARTPAAPTANLLRVSTASHNQPRSTTAPDAVPSAISPAPLLVPDATMRRRLLSARKPVFPRAALLAHLSGSVVLSALIARDGSVKRVDVVRGDPDFINAAVAAVTWWRYQPFLVRGQPTPVRTEIPLDFPAQ